MVDAFVTHERGETKVRRLSLNRGAWSVEVGINRGLNDAAFAAVGSRDPFPNRLGNPNEVGDTGRRFTVPFPQTVEDPTRDGTSDRLVRPVGKIRLASIPGISHWGEAVADVGHSRWSDDSFGHAVRETDNEVY
jgi:hypothetical protein